ncbi:histidine utilization repressor [Rhizobium wenxiniae]|uniref:Histidine utilization repressor n=1 Tax=Rhizobium wenxiniae TaxID=1737357 RepID=A0A7W9YA59_9HYPH|nr:histidine utilization repressor [Rhizobium wenxiniae]MBB6163998.1 GntR family histidine utilization transcriptional repressor [Rhizobium wenxiniae]GGG04123.1 histidine utilization repressor [Rhizobium wenxiniae]
MTLHRKILADIEEKIVSGAWPPGHRIPFEVDLAAHYDVSRMTVNKVMGQLAQAGLIERRKKGGSFVSQPKAQSAVLEIHDIADEVRSLNLEYSYQQLSITRRKAIGEELAWFANGSPGDVLFVTCLHLAAGQPFCLEERAINLATVPAALEADFISLAPGPWLSSQIPWITAQHRIQAVPADRKEHKLLNLTPKQACLVIERRTWNTSGAVTWVRMTYPGNRHVVTADFRPASA